MLNFYFFYYLPNFTWVLLQHFSTMTRKRFSPGKDRVFLLCSNKILFHASDFSNTPCILQIGTPNLLHICASNQEHSIGFLNWFIICSNLKKAVSQTTQNFCFSRQTLFGTSKMILTLALPILGGFHKSWQQLVGYMYCM